MVADEEVAYQPSTKQNKDEDKTKQQQPEKQNEVEPPTTTTTTATTKSASSKEEEKDTPKQPTDNTVTEETQVLAPRLPSLNQTHQDSNDKPKQADNIQTFHDVSPTTTA